MTLSLSILTNIIVISPAQSAGEGKTFVLIFNTRFASNGHFFWPLTIVQNSMPIKVNLNGECIEFWNSEIYPADKKIPLPA